MHILKLIYLRQGVKHKAQMPDSTTLHSGPPEAFESVKEDTFWAFNCDFIFYSFSKTSPWLFVHIPKQLQSTLCNCF